VFFISEKRLDTRTPKPEAESNMTLLETDAPERPSTAVRPRNVQRIVPSESKLDTEDKSEER
jgi:hypothetical protein